MGFKCEYSVIFGSAKAEQQEKRSLTWMGAVGTLRAEGIILPNDSLGQNCVREGCQMETGMDILKMISLQCCSLSWDLYSFMPSLI